MRAEHRGIGTFRHIPLGVVGSVLRFANIDRYSLLNSGKGLDVAQGSSVNHHPAAHLASRLVGLTARGVVALMLVVSFGGAPAEAQSREIKPEWDDPEIKQFVARARRNRAATTSALFDPRLSQLKLPVLGYQRSVPRVRNAFGVGARPRQRRVLTMDPRNPVWYQIGYDYGDDVTITVEADLRIQQKLPAGTSLYAPPKNFSLGTDTEIAVFREESAPGASGSIAEFKVVKYGIPYTVTLECSAAKREICEDVDQIRKDRALLKLIFARPPQQ